MKRKGLFLFIFLFFLLLQFTPLFFVSAYAAELNGDIDIITNVSITDRNGDPLPAEADKNADVKITYQFAIPDYPAGTAGDTFTMSVPNEFLLDSDLTTDILINGTTLLATADLDATARTIVLTFEEVAFTYLDVTGEFWFDVSFDGDQIANENPVDIVFDIGQGLTETVPVNFNQPDPPEATLVKSGVYDSANKEITWTLNANEEGASITDLEIYDSITAEHEFIADSVTLNGAAAVLGSDYTYDAGTPALTFLFSGPVSTQQEITYKTKVLNSALLAETTNTLAINNNADLIADGFTIPSNTVTINIGVDLLDKSGAYTMADKEIAWTLTVNENGLTVLNSVITENIPSGLTLDNTSVYDNGVQIFEGTGDGTFSISGQDFAVDLGDIAEEHVVTYVTAVDNAAYVTQTREAFNNSATLTGTDVVANNTATNTVTPDTRIIDKNSGGYDASTGVLSWEIVVNGNDVSLDDVVITDLATTGQEYIIGSFAIVDSVGTSYSGGTLVTEDATGFEYDFPVNITGEYTITFDTQITDAALFQGNATTTVSNTATVTLSNGTGGTDQASQTATSVVLSKSAGTYDYVTRQMSWTIIVNENQNSLDNVIVSDTIPVDQEFLSGSFSVVDSVLALYSGGSLVSDANSFSYTFPGTITDTYTITYNTHLVDLSVLEVNQEVTLNNDSSLTHDAITSSDISASADFTSEVISKSSDYSSGNDYIDWEVVINRNQISYDNALITDAFEEGLALDTSSITLYEASVSSNNAITQGAQVAISGDNIAYDLNTRTFSFLMPTSISTAYILTFRTYVTDKSLTPFDNSVTIEADGVLPEGNELPDDVAVTFAGSGGSASGGVGSLTVTKVDADNNSIVLAGGVFELLDQYDIIVDRVTTDSNGEAFFDRLRFDVPYTVYEATPPEGYNPSESGSDSHTFTIGASDPETNITYTFENTQIIGNIELTKRDENSNPLVGAEFTLYEGGAATVYTATSDVDGLVSFTDIPYGTYTLTETSAPTGYVLAISQPTASITVHGATVTASPASISNRLIASDITFTKLDENSNPLSNAVFTLFDSTNTIVSTATSGLDGVVLFEDVDFGDYTVVETTAPDGYTRSDTVHSVSVTTDGATITLTSPDFTNTPLNAAITFTKLDPEGNGLYDASFALYDDSNTLVDTATSSALGVVTFNNPAPGDYTIVETAVPIGYVLNSTVLTATVPDNISDAVIVASPGTLTNDYILGTILLNKFDDNNRPLQGAEFTLYDDLGTAIDTAVSDSSGLVSFTTVRYGDYTIRETQAPEGYLASTDVFTASIITDGEIVTANPASASNKQIVGSITFDKVGEENDPLSDAVFTLYAASDTDHTSPLTTATSDASGVVAFNTVIYGDYEIVETTAPEGYALSTDALSASVRIDGDTITASPDVFENTRIRADITVRLLSRSGIPLSGGVIGLYSESEEVAKETTDSDGYVTFARMLFGTYTLKQLEAPEGFILSDEVLEVSVLSEASVYEAGVITDLPIETEDGRTVTTGDSIIIYILGLVAAIILFALVIVFYIKRRRNNE